MRKPKLSDSERKQFEWYAMNVNRCGGCNAEKILRYLLWCEDKIRVLEKKLRSKKKNEDTTV